MFTEYAYFENKHFPVFCCISNREFTLTTRFTFQLHVDYRFQSSQCAVYREQESTCFLAILHPLLYHILSHNIGGTPHNRFLQILQYVIFRPPNIQLLRHVAAHLSIVCRSNDCSSFVICSLAAFGVQLHTRQQCLAQHEV